MKLMNRSVSFVVFASLLTGCSPKPKVTEEESAVAAQADSTMRIEYPQTQKGETIDTYFGKEVGDPYRWLEDDRSDQTKSWVTSQNDVTQGYLQNITYREQIEEKVRSIIDYERVSAPFEEGDYTYFFQNDGLQNQSVLYRKMGGSEPEVFLDPNSFSEDGTTSMPSIAFSQDASMVAYATSTGGSDWREIFVMDVESKELIGEPLQDVKFSGIAWFKNEGFYYSSYDKPTGSELSDKTDQHKVYYHRIGTSQSEDLNVFGHTEDEKHRYIFAQVSEDDRFLFLSAANTTSGNRAFVKDLADENAVWKTVKQDITSDVSMLTSEDDQIFMVTNHEAANTKVVSVSIDAPSLENWQDVVPESENVLSASTAGGFIYARYMVDAVSKVYQYTLEGEQVREVALPGIGSVGSFGGKKDTTKTYFTFTNYVTPSSIFELDIASGESALYNQPDIRFDPSEYISEQVFYNSKDGTRVPMIITRHKDSQKDGTNPTMLYGYGGFNISLTPRFSPTVAAWLELGGIYAVPNIRGGGEYGKEWHRAGTQMQKQNVFDDFIAAAEYLIENQYTSSQYLALRGGSNGGLLVGAVMTQRPEIAAVALPAVGVLDMLRYHTFTAGAGWSYDYGTAEQSEEMFNYLLSYSPLHNVKEGQTYPATLITTADHDDRVVPAHSFKFAAELQAKQSGATPTLIRIETDAGHGAGKPISKVIEETADIYGFTLYNMGIESLPAAQDMTR